MVPDTIVVITKATDTGRNLLPLWTGVGGAAIGIIGTAIASTVAYQVAKRQIGAQRDIATATLDVQRSNADRQLKAATLSSNRVRWIEQLRAEVAGYITIVDNLHHLPADRYVAQMEKATLHVAMLSLMLNFEEPESKALFDATTAVSDYLDAHGSTRPGGYDDLYKLLGAVAKAARVILKKEWARVKQVE